MSACVFVQWKKSVLREQHFVWQTLHNLSTVASHSCAFYFLAFCFLRRIFLFIDYFLGLIFKGRHSEELFSADTLVGSLRLSFNIPAGFLGRHFKRRTPSGITIHFVPFKICCVLPYFQPTFSNHHRLPLSASPPLPHFQTQKVQKTDLASEVAVVGENNPRNEERSSLLLPKHKNSS